MFKPILDEIPPYRVATPAHRIKLNQNECARELPAPIRRRILARMRAEAWRRYPAFPADALRRRLARRLRHPRDGILVGNGSNEVLLSAVLATVRRGGRVVVAAPGYPVFERFTRIAEGRIRRVPLDRELRFRVDALVREGGRAKTALVLLASPNNPTGSVLTPADVERIASATGALVVIDEAYREFSRFDYRSLLRRAPNLVLTRTFSKAFALAGLRIGYAMGAPDVIRRLEAATLPFNLDLFSRIAAEEVLDASDLVAARAKEIVVERERVRCALAELDGPTVFPSDANFLLARFPDGHRAWRGLLRRGILVRDVSAQPGLDDCLRITIGTRRENDALLAALRETFA
jgi:histidinol-phosphate aminotransferase